ncbi:MAG: NACHT domain-containing protein [Pseudonocardia sp.]
MNLGISNVVYGVGAVAAGLAAMSALDLWRREKSSAEFATEEASAIARVRAMLRVMSTYMASRSLDMGLEVSVEIKRPRSIATETELASAFIASLSQDPQCTFIVGAPGSGKTVLLVRLARQIAESYSCGRQDRVPLLINCSTWTAQTEFTTWVTSEVRSRYGVSRELTMTWINRGSSLLLLDGLDEVQSEPQHRLAVELSRWLNSPVGGKAIVTCRASTYFKYTSIIPHEQVASLQPLSQDVVKRYIREVVNRVVPSEQREAVTESARRLLTDSDLYHKLDDGSPLIVQMIVDALKLMELQESLSPDDDPGSAAIKVGDDLLKKGELSAALNSYLTASKFELSPWKAVAGLKASLLLAQQGNTPAAKEAFERSVASRLHDSVSAELQLPSQQLTDNEKKILEVLDTAKRLDSYQIGSRANLPPSLCNAALRTLRDYGFIDIVDKSSSMPRFRRASADLIGH